MNEWTIIIYTFTFSFTYLLLLTLLRYISGRKTQAIELYLKGIDELNKGISLDVTGQGTLYLFILFI